MDEQDPRGKVDRTAILYIVGGVPSLVAFIIALFFLVRACNIPA